MKIAVIGLGAMGTPMAENLLKSGDHSLRIFDLDREKVKSLEEKGAEGFATAAEAAETADIILTSLPNDAILKSVLSGENGVIQTCSAGSVIVDLSSVSPATAIEMAGEAKAKEVGYLDSPVSGGVAGAVAGTLTIMAGGEETDFSKALPVLEIIGKKINRIGGVGSGDAVKIVNNLLLGCHMAALSEALKLGESCGLTKEKMFEIIRESSGASYVLNAKMEKFIIPAAFDGGFAVDLQKKDLNLALDTAKQAGMSLEITEKARDLFADASEAGLGAKDMSVVTTLKK